MSRLGITEEEIDQVWQLIVAILHMGNIDYRVDEADDSAHIADHSKASVARAAELFQLPDVARFSSSLETKVSKFGKELISSPLQKDGAISCRNSAAKSIYGRLFNWIVGKINANILEKMSANDDNSNTETIFSLGILDIFGFESFKKNSFE